MINIKSVVYPQRIAKRIAALQRAGSLDSDPAVGRAPSFSCGSAVQFFLSIYSNSREVVNARFVSNGCGYMLAAADCLAEFVAKKSLADLHGLSDGDLNGRIQETLGNVPSDRRECVISCIEALRAAFANFRQKQIKEFHGEKALICSCFGVSEETIESLIEENSLREVDEVANKCRAGSGCGSCRMLIQEMLDMYGAR